jgi:hypothetical protein
MIRKTIILTLTICLSLVLFLPSSIQAQNALNITRNTTSTEFPDGLHFNLSAQSRVNITDVRLHYTVDHTSFAEVTSEVFIEFIPDTTIEVKWIWDMRKTGGLPPGTTVEYWWTIINDQGDRALTDPIKVSFDDNRYIWQNLTEDEITIYWYHGEKSAAEEMMLASRQALTQLAKDTGAELKKAVKIYLYANTRDLQGAMIHPQEWTGGTAFTNFGTITIGLVPSSPDSIKRAIAHELTHLVIAQVTFNPYNELPTWLNEGLAMYNEGPLETEFTNLLKKAIAKNSLISVRSLSSPFSAYAESAMQAYAQSQNLVEFLIKNYGQTKMFQLLNVFHEGSSYNNALIKVYGFDMDGLNTLWRDYTIKKYREAEVTTAMILPPIARNIIRQASELLSNVLSVAPSWVLNRG